MELGYAIMKGVVQGLTEFLPVSSTAHLVFTDVLDHWFHWQMERPSVHEEEFFNVVIQVGTLGAVLFYFRHELWLMLQTALGKVDRTQHSESEIDALKKLPMQLAFSMVITIAFILFMKKASEPLIQMMGLYRAGSLEDISDMIFQIPQLVAVDLIFTGILLWVSQSILVRRTSDPTPHVNYQQAGLIGLFQGFSAIFHGLSRSGSTISAGLLAGLDRVTAARYSFLLSIPTFILATIYECYKFAKIGVIGDFNWFALAVGTITACVVGYYCVKAFVDYVGKHSLRGFAIYCWIVGVALFTALTLNPIPIMPK